MATESEPRLDITKIDDERFVRFQEVFFKIKGNGDNLINEIKKAATSMVHSLLPCKLIDNI
jgi:hypothetical protein